MIRTVVTAGLVLALGAFALAWLDLQQATHRMTPELYVALIAIAFACGGLWLGWRIAARRHGPEFVRNDAAVRSLGLTGQEMKVLDALASGRVNKEIARALGLSPNTIKTHLANLFAKLEVTTRTSAVTRARDLSLIP
ncbi:response regulator transcription factor [Brevundimonas staleyi]|uniref:Response regulator transcription factor n=1 Tax=Brevundimonas staleyi TaxID=74326 RepID=A0ABW0FVA2_9CAUL